MKFLLVRLYTACIDAEEEFQGSTNIFLQHGRQKSWKTTIKKIMEYQYQRKSMKENTSHGKRTKLFIPYCLKNFRMTNYFLIKQMNTVRSFRAI